MTTCTSAPLTVKDYKSSQEVRWCPGCGDYSVPSVLQKTLAARQVPVFAEHRLIAVWEVDHEIMDTGQSPSLLDLLSARVDSAVPDVLSNGPHEEHRILQADSDVAHQAAARHSVDVVTIQQYAPSGRTMKPT